MKMISRIQKWGDAHHPAWFDLFRIALGVVLMWKGIQFAIHLSAFTELMSLTEIGRSIGISLVAHLVIVIHILGGLMIMLGTNTVRPACFSCPLYWRPFFW